MCACAWNFTWARHREPNPDLPDGDDPWNDHAEPPAPEQERNNE